MPIISIIIPTLNSEKTVGMCLERITKLDYPQDKLEILVIDGGSGDNTLNIAREFSVRIVVESKKGRGAAYNRGLKGAKGEYIAFVDSDAFVSQNWLKVAVEVLNRNPLIAVLHFKNKAPQDVNYFQKCVDTLQTKSWGQANGAVYRKTLVEKVGGFEESLLYLQEDELRVRLINAGYKAEVMDEPVVYHLPREDIWSYFMQSIESGIGLAKLCFITRHYKCAAYSLSRDVLALFPVVLLVSLVFFQNLAWALMLWLLIGTVAYSLYLWYSTNREYKAVKYILPALALVWVSSLGSFVGNVVGVRQLKPHKRGDRNEKDN